MTVIDLRGKGVRLGDLIKKEDVTIGGEWQGDFLIPRLVFHSQEVQAGDVFFAIPPLKDPQKAQDHIQQAISQKAALIIKESPFTLPSKGEAVLLDIRDARHLKALMARRLYPGQPKVVVGVTGTNGKTSVVDFTRQLWDLLGHSSASLGTLGLLSSIDASELPDVSHTSPDPFHVHQALSLLAKKGVTHLAMEVSSHGLDQSRLDGVNFTAAAFTNLTHDHLDYHGTMEQYFEAKKRLFATLLPEGETAILNADTNYYTPLKELCQQRGIRVIGYGKRCEEEGIRLEDLMIQGSQQVALLSIFGQSYRVELNFIGKFQVLNALCALGFLIATGTPAPEAVPLLSKLRPVPGRLELIGMTKKGGAVYVDYAHTPDALAEALLSIRPYVEGVLTLVFGCGGDRDAQKRPIMGKIAGEYSDAQIVTDDNPRSEDPAKIRQEIMRTCKNVLEIGDRTKAITKAINRLTKGDACVIAGKGHETTQIIKDQVIPFDDRALAKAIIQKSRGVVY